jgi:tRNA pseudouridine13 synthase
MIPSPYPLELDLGMRYYASDSPGIGGILRSRPEDFIVEEIPGFDLAEGPYLICKLTKINWEMHRAVKEIAKQLGISHKRISWAGTKDKHAQTTQYISLYKVTPGEIDNVSLKDLTLEVIGFSGSPIHLGNLGGNRFTITIRNCSASALESRVLSIMNELAGGIPNYFGLQRFGSIRPISHLVGRDLLKEDYEGAVFTYIGLACQDEPDATFAVRSDYAANRDVKLALRQFPVVLSYERALLHHLSMHPDDFSGALRVFPPKLLSMFVSAYQSFLFNHALSRRMEIGPLNSPYPGDYLVFSDGKTDRVTGKNLRTAEVHCSRGRCNLALFIPGSLPVQHPGIADQLMLEIMEGDGIDPECFSRISAFLGVPFNGTTRLMSSEPEITFTFDENWVRLRFSLPPGSYATAVCREFMKGDPRLLP